MGTTANRGGKEGLEEDVFQGEGGYLLGEGGRYKPFKADRSTGDSVGVGGRS